VGPVVVDTGVFGADLSESSKPLADLYAALLDGRNILISFATVAELRYGALRAGWDAKRRKDLEDSIGTAKTVWPSHDLINEYARLRSECLAAGHVLAEKSNEAHRWIAATARFVGVPLVSHDSVFVNTPGLELLNASQSEAERTGRNQALPPSGRGLGATGQGTHE
jgi:tRNA(fMet)-specific endonuclease VapC